MNIKKCSRKARSRTVRSSLHWRAHERPNVYCSSITTIPSPTTSVQAFAVLGADVLVHRNDQITVDRRVPRADALVHFAGPGTPHDAGVSMKMIEAFAGKLPALGVCLGHQSIVEVLAAKS